MSEKQILLDIQINYKTAVNAIVELQKRIDAVRNQQLELNSALKAGTISQDDYSKGMVATNSLIKDLKESQKNYTNEIQTSLKAQKEQEGSLKQLRAELKNLLKSYDELSREDREEIGGIGENTLLRIRELQKELKEAEEVSGRFQRNVGSYEDAIKNALSGQGSMRSVLKQIREELVNLNYQYDSLSGTITDQKTKIATLTQTYGSNSEEVKTAIDELNKLESTYKEVGKSIQELSQQAGAVDDAMKKTSGMVASAGDSEAQIKSLVASGQLLLNTYTLMNSSMVALGIESDTLMNIFAKLQILQSGLNAVSAISAALQEESILRVTISNALATIRAKLEEDYTETIEDENKALVENTAITTTQTSVTTAQTVATNVGTKANNKFVISIKAIGAAIKSIPVIGWIIGAVAALGTLTTMLIKHRREEKELNRLERERLDIQKKINDINLESNKSVSVQSFILKQNIQLLKTLDTQSWAYKSTLESIAETLGVEVDWLQENINKVEELGDEWVKTQVKMKQAELLANKIAENNLKLSELNDSQSLLSRLQNIDYKDRFTYLTETYNLSNDIAEKIVKSSHKLIKDGVTSETNREYTQSVIAARNELTDQNNKFIASYNDVTIASRKTSNRIKNDTKDVTNTTSKSIKTIKDETTSLTQEIEEYFKITFLENMFDGVDKELAKVDYELDKFIKTWNDKAVTATKEQQKQINDIIKKETEKAEKEKEKIRSNFLKRYSDGVQNVYDTLGKVKLPPSVESLKEYQEILKNFKSAVDTVLEQIKEINEQIKNTTDDEVKKELEKQKEQSLQGFIVIGDTLITNPHRFELNRKESAEKVFNATRDNKYNTSYTEDAYKKIEDFDNYIKKYNEAIDILKNGGDVSEIRKYFNFIIAFDEINTFAKWIENLSNNKPSEDEDKKNRGFKSDKQISNNRTETLRLQEILTNLISIRDKGEKLEEEKENKSKLLRYNMALNIEAETKVAQNKDNLNEYNIERNRLIEQGLDTTDIDNKIKFTEEQLSELNEQLNQYDNNIKILNDDFNKLSEKQVEIGFVDSEHINKEIEKVKENIDVLAQSTKDRFYEIATDIGTSISNVLGSLQSMLSEIAGDNQALNKYLAAVSYAQIGVALAVSIAESVKEASKVAFPLNFVAIASGVSAVLAAIGSAFAVYRQYNKQPSTPKFADGGLIGGKTTNNIIGRKDDVTILASNGEFIVNAEATKKHLKELIAINGGWYNDSLKFADGGLVMSNRKEIMNQTQIQNIVIDTISNIHPVVSVKEITRVQNRVQLKENITKQ